jgi:hypothetical protein
LEHKVLISCHNKALSERPGFQSMLTGIEAVLVETVIVKDIMPNPY